MGIHNPVAPGSLLKPASDIKAIDPPKKKEPSASKQPKEKDAGRKEKDAGKKAADGQTDETPADPTD